MRLGVESKQITTFRSVSPTLYNITPQTKTAEAHRVHVASLFPRPSFLFLHIRLVMWSTDRPSFLSPLGNYYYLPGRRDALLCGNGSGAG